MASVGSLIIDLVAGTGELRADMGKAERLVKSSSARMNRALATLDRGFKRLGRAAGGMVKRLRSLKGGVGALIGGAGLALLIRKSLDVGDAIAKASSRIGLSSAALQTYQFAAELTGTSQERLVRGFEAFTKRIGEARAGMGTFRQFLQKTNAALLDQVLAAKSNDAALELVFDEMARLTKASDRAALSASAFSRTAGVELTNIVRDGADALKAMRDRAVDLGLVLKDKTLRAIEEAKDALTTMGRIIQFNVVRAIAALAPTIIRLGEAFARIAPQIKGFVESFLPTSLAGPEELQKRIRALGDEIIKLESETKGEATDFLQLGGEFSADRGRISALVAQREELQRILVTAAKAEAETRKLLAALGDGEIAGGVGISTVPDATQSPAAREAIERGRAITQAMRTAQEVFDDTIRQLGLLRDAHVDTFGKAGISVETYARAVKDAEETLDAATEKTDSFANVAEDAGLVMASSFEDAALRVRDMSSALDAAKSLAEDLIKILLRSAITAPLAGAFKGFFTPETAAAGGIAGKGRRTARSSVAAFAGAPSFGGGGIVPVLAHRGEGIFTPEQMDNADRLIRAAARGGGANVEIMIEQPKGHRARVQERRGGQGQRQVEVVFDEAVDRTLRGGGRTTRTLGGGGLIPR